MIIYGSMRHSYSGKKLKRTQAKSGGLKKYRPPSFQTYVPKEVVRRNDTSHIPSVHTIRHSNTDRKESPRYTGTYIKGIATMHKSNAVPVTNSDQAKDLASMRR